MIHSVDELHLPASRSAPLLDIVGVPPENKFAYEIRARVPFPRSSQLARPKCRSRIRCRSGISDVPERTANLDQARKVPRAAAGCRVQPGAAHTGRTDSATFPDFFEARKAARTLNCERVPSERDFVSALLVERNGSNWEPTMRIGATSFYAPDCPVPEVWRRS
jgi:hypothetical protein